MCGITLLANHGSDRVFAPYSTLCEPECPVEAIYSEDELPEDQQKFLALNEELSREWPVITEMKDPPQNADDWRDIKNKFQYLER